MRAECQRPGGRFRMWPAPLVVLSAALVLLLCSGVAGGATLNASPKKWVSAFCGSALTLKKQQESGFTDLIGLLAKYQKGDVPLSTVKAGLVKYMADTVGAFDDVTERLKRVGPPAVKNGNALQQGELRVFGQEKRAFQNMEKAIQALSTSNKKTFAKGIAPVLEQIPAEEQKVGAAGARLHKYRSKALTNAARHEPACNQVRGFLP